MNYPQQGFPQQQPGQQQVYAPPQQQQPGQQFAPPGQQFAPPGQFSPQGAPNLGQAAAGNLFNQFLAEPPRKRANRAKPSDGNYVVRFTPGCKMDFSQKDARPYLLLEYQVIESSAPQMGGQVFSIPIFWANRIQLQDLADLAKYTFGQNLPQVAGQTGGNPQMMAQFICQTLAQGLFAGVRVSRSQKQIQSVGYEQAFANHGWIAISQQPMTLAQLGPALGPPQAPTQQFQQAFQPMAQPQQQAMPQPQQFQQLPQQQAMPQPQQFQQLPQQPMQAPQQQFQPLPQQPMQPQQFQQLPQQPQFPQATPALPQQPLPQQAPAPAFYVPNGAQPPR